MRNRRELLLSRRNKRRAPQNAPLETSALSAINAMVDMAGAFAGAETYSQELNCWHATLKSADAEILPEKDIMTARAYDLARNTGYGAGVVAAIKDDTIGHAFRFQATPDHKLLGLEFEVANDWANQFERLFNLYWQSVFVDAARKRNGTQLLRDALGYQVLAGESLLVKQYRDNQTGFSTCWSLVEPERLGNVMGVTDTVQVRAGITLNQYGEATSYSIRRKHPQDIGGWGFASTADTVQKYSATGQLQVIHTFDGRANQTRGYSQFASVLAKFYLRDKMIRTEMSAATLAASRPLVIESDHGPESAFGALRDSSGQDGYVKCVKTHFDMKNAWSSTRPVTFDGAKVTHLFGGEKLHAIPSSYPHSNLIAFDDLQSGEMSRGLNVSRERLTGDFSKTSYSSARFSNEVAHKSNLSRRANGVEPIANEIKNAFAYEMFAKGVIVPPAGIVASPLDSWVTFQALMKGYWIGSPKVRVDENKAAVANRVMLETGETTLADIAAENGQNWEELLEQRQRELKRMEELGIPEPAAYNAPVEPQPNTP